jgi:hypothetical protein
MKLENYVASRTAIDPRFEHEQIVAKAELAFTEAMVDQRNVQQLSLVALSDLTGIAVERLEALEEGESATLHEVLWLSHALNLVISVTPDLQIWASVSVNMTPRILLPAS